MPSKKKKYNARFPAGRIKKIMQTDEEVGKVAQAVPVIISRTLELFVESLLKRAMQITSAKNAKTLTPSHMKQCILSESRFDFLKDLVKGIPDVSSTDDEPGTPIGSLSPGVIMPSANKAHSGFSCFQFRQSSDSSSSKNPGATSQLSSIPETSQPKFYNEIPIGNDDVKIETNACGSPIEARRPPVIQHTGSQIFNSNAQGPTKNEEQATSIETAPTGPRKIPLVNQVKGQVVNYIKSETGDSSSDEAEEEPEPEPEENGFHQRAIVTKTCIIDEDYDT